MRKVTVKVYQYDELNDKAKERARGWFLQGRDNRDAFDNIVEDAKQVGLLITELYQHRANEGGFEVGPMDTIDRILANHGDICETYKTATRYKERLGYFSEDDDDETSVEYENYQNAKREFLHDLLEDYRVMCDKEVEYQQSEEYVSEMMKANEYEFTEDGRRFR